MSADQPPSAPGRDQFSLLLGLWWRHMRRRPRRLGDLPKQSGAPTFLLINLLSLGYLVPFAFASVKQSIAADVGNFAWHALGVVAAALGSGLSSRTLALQGRARDDLFLEALPLALSARLGLALLDRHLFVLLASIVPLAGLVALGERGGPKLPVILFGWLLYLSVFLAGSALRAWLRVLGPPATARVTGYVGTGLTLAGFGLTYFSLRLLVPPSPMARAIAEAWLVDDARLGALYGVAVLLGLGAYSALARAERRGFDRLEVATSAPRQRGKRRSRRALEGLMIWRQGGKLLLVTFSALLLFIVGSALLPADDKRFREQGAYLVAIGITVYLGSIQTIGLAGRSARGDLVARPFLSALPLAPHQVLEGKAVVLRWMLVPVFLALAFLAIAALYHGHPEIGLRALLASVALYVIVAGAVAVAFLASGVGVAGVAGGQVGSSFSTQLLLMPMMATVFAGDAAAASVSLIAVVAVSREALRAARLSVRWIDDSDQDAERETSVWRALLAATVFFSTQMFSVGVLGVFQIHGAYARAIGFAFAAGVLVVLTLRSRARFDRPHIAPRWPWYLPLGLLAGAASGQLAVWAIQRTGGALPYDRSTMGETAALLVSSVLVAPLAEEYFFRGWLQRAIEEDLPQQHKRWAFALGALAFALSHVGSYGLPQLVVGLITGWLYANGGGLASAVLAHAAHNAVVMHLGFQR